MNCAHVSRWTKCLVAFLVVLSCTSVFAQPAPSLQPRVILEQVASSQVMHDGIQVRSGSAQIVITALRDDIIRVRIAPGDTLPEDASWAVLAGPRGKTIDVQPAQDANSVGFRTAALDVRVERSPLRLVVRDLAGNIICSDAIGQPTEFNLGGFSVHKEMARDEHFFGLGDKAGTFDRREQAYTLWNTDVGPQEAIDPLYKSIPFFMGIRGGRSYGLFLDNTWRTWFDFGKQARNAYSFGAEGGPLNYYLIYGPAPKQVVEAYAYLTGTPPLPPLWGLGFQQSRYSYTPESQIREVANRLRSDKIPSDVVYLDIDYQDRNRPFTTNSKDFPNFPGLVADLKKQHFHLVLITDLHVAYAPNQGYMPYDTGHAGDHFVKNPDGSEFVGIVWPGKSVFPDFTRAQTREWWGGLYKQFVTDGVAGFWNDMNEPAVFEAAGKTMPLDTVHRIEEPGFATRTAPHTEIHNVFGTENQRATYEGLLKLRPEERPFVLTRATYAGGQRYGWTWTGDNSATWNHLRLGTQMLLNLGLSGISFVGDDIGGFNASPPPDLLTRWIEIGAFNPLFRDHSTKGSLPQEVWVHGPQHEAIRRRYIETRYRLMPYIYTLADEASRTGMPLVRPVFLEFPEIFTSGTKNFDALDTEFLFGPSFLIAPSPLAETMDDYVVSMPSGDWYDFWSGRRLPSAASSASAAHTTEPPTIHQVIETLPVYVRGGSIIPLQPLVQNTDELPNGPLELRVYPGSSCNGSIYLDDGRTFRYKNGEFLRQAFTCSSESNSISVEFGERQGIYAPWWRSVEVVIYEWPSAKADVSLPNGAKPMKTTYAASAHTLHVVIPDLTAGEVRIVGK